MVKIAIVDDEKAILDVLRTFLKRSFEVDTFSNPVEALKAIKTSKYDLVLCDVMMPKLDGLSLLKKLNDSGCYTKFIMMTAFDSVDKALDAHRYGAKDYIKKPFEILEEIQEKILEYI